MSTFSKHLALFLSTYMYTLHHCDPTCSCHWRVMTSGLQATHILRHKKVCHLELRTLSKTATPLTGQVDYAARMSNSKFDSYPGFGSLASSLLISFPCLFSGDPYGLLPCDCHHQNQTRTGVELGPIW
jgi:hypothetical protein